MVSADSKSLLLSLFDSLYARVVLVFRQQGRYFFHGTSRSCRARFPADQGCLDATSSVAASRNASVLLFEALARLGGRLRLPGALRRRPPSAAAALRAAGPRFARLG